MRLERLQPGEYLLTSGNAVWRIACYRDGTEELWMTARYDAPAETVEAKLPPDFLENYHWQATQDRLPTLAAAVASVT